ncbi:MAG: metalloregulator ArsR/SmtB family transcription factor [Acidocella sp.]|nr:metalloregulator ArsR/SmtB family transcription factor [Acidocella sp.]
MDQADFPTVLRFFKALAHESRLRLLGMVAERAHNVQELAARLDLTEPTASHHLAILRGLGLVTLRVEGNNHWYTLNPDALTQAARAVLSREQVAGLAPGANAPDREQAILRNFVTPEGVLTQIPVNRKKRRVILAWLVRKFDLGRAYSELEVNKILQKHHNDPATLRRDLIGYKMVSRQSGEYRRLEDSEWQP